MNINWIILLAVIVIVIIIGLIFIFRKKTRGTRMSSQVYVGNLPYRVRELDLKTQFTKYGNILEVRIVKNPKTGQSRGYAFVTFQNPDEAKKSLVLHGAAMSGRKMVVRIAKPAKTTH